jgi:putative effector of murein hydrolase LrgA (UPF0299 family)
MNELLMAFLILSGLFLAFKIIQNLMQIFMSASLLILVIVFIALAVNSSALRIPTETEQIKSSIEKSIDEMKLSFEDLIK